MIIINLNSRLMTKKLLSFLGALVISVFMNAQTTTWNFSDSVWPVSAGYSAPTVVNNLGFITGTTTNMGAIEANTATIDGLSFTQRLKFNGGSYTSGTTEFAMPTQRALYFDVNGASTIKIWYKNGGGGTRTLYVTDGTKVISSFPYTDSSVGQVATVNYTGEAGRIYIAADQSMNIYQITATNVGTTASLATVNVNKNLPKIYASGNEVSILNVSGKSQVEVYSMNGALVKSLNTTSDVKFQLQNKGIYIVNVKSNDKPVSQKVLIK
ncbi:T9SS C-terminal target domain-containing protein [Chryseobacterium sp. H3056]|uniref:T9SS C-terminal target domain-containing protein n=2 Tax=Kaistella daneshvariae TaxID=2487074 RepID=A0A3N0WYG3_9FLAO|nr:T9SS C-terminal target domain-containing protein [Kaistella daneshvariae]